MSKRTKRALIKEWFELHKGELADDWELAEQNKPLKEVNKFKAFKVDSVLETIVWDNGADIAPEYLHKRMKVLA